MKNKKLTDSGTKKDYMKKLLVVSSIVLLASCEDKSKNSMFDDAKNLKIRSITTSKGKLNVMEGDLEKFRQEIKPLSPQDLAFIQSQVKASRAFISKYSSNADVSKANYLKTLDEAYKNWLLSNAPDKPSDKVVVQILGSAFGQFIVENLNMEWVEENDRYGTAWGVRHRETQTICFPYSSVIKRINKKEFNFMENIFNLLETRIKTPPGLDEAKKQK